MPSLLSLDISTQTGWAYWSDVSKRSRPLCDTWKLPKVRPADYGARTTALEAHMNLFLRDHEALDGIAFESPFIPMGLLAPKDGENSLTTTMHTLRLQMALATMVEHVATKFGIPCLEVATQSAKVALIGFGQRPRHILKKDWDWKREMLIAATRAGYRVSNDHEADAVAVGKVAAEHFWGIAV
jgi:hypothetical protein